jgi:hypothetical protein
MFDFGLIQIVGRFVERRNDEFQWRWQFWFGDGTRAVAGFKGLVRIMRRAPPRLWRIK